MDNDESCPVCGGEPGYLGIGECEHGEVDGDLDVGMEYALVCVYPDDACGVDCEDRLSAKCCPIGCTACPKCDCRLMADGTPASR